VGSLSRQDILRAFEALSDELARSGDRVELALGGGAAMVLLFGARETTKDVDAVSVGVTNAPRFDAACSHVAEALSLPPDWLNDGFKGFLHGLALGPPIFEAPSLIVRALLPRQLLALKLSAWRDDLDIEDARLLLTCLSDDRETVWEMIEPHLVHGREMKARYAFDDLWESALGSR